MLHGVMKPAMALLLGLNLAWAQAADFYPVPQELWDSPRSGRSILEQENLRQAMAAYTRQPDSLLVIHYGNTQDAQLQATELRSWFMSLAVQPARILLEGDLSASDPLSIEIRTKK